MKEETVPQTIPWRRLRPRVTRRLLARITRQIVEHFHPEKVILFGSYAYGRPTSESDVDLLVIMDSSERPARRTTLVSSVCRPRHLGMDILVYTSAEVKQRLEMGDFFIGEILQAGRVLYDATTTSSVSMDISAWRSM